MIGRKDKKLEEHIGNYGEKIVLEVQELVLNTRWEAEIYNKKRKSKNK